VEVWVVRGTFRQNGYEQRCWVQKGPGMRMEGLAGIEEG
jgi:hypothetical protein